MVSFFRGAGPTVLAFFWPGIGVLIGLIAMGLVAAYGSPNWLTKIIVGITLTQFDSLGHRLYYIAALIGSYLKFADSPSSGIGVGYGVIIGFAGAA